MTAPQSTLARNVVDLLKPGMRVFVGGSVNEPKALIEQLQSERLPSDIEFVQFPIGGLNSTDFTALSETSRQTTVFMTPQLSGADPKRLSFLPMGMRQFFDYVRQDIDLAMVQLGLDAAGNLRSGPNVDFLDALLDSRAQIAAQLNTAWTAPSGARLVPPDRLACLVCESRPLPVLPAAKIDPVAAQIGAHVATLIADGDCLQTGIGAIPAAILGALSDKNDLGWHGGLVDDGMLDLVSAGNVTGARKSIDKGLHVTGMALCSAPYQERLAELPNIVFRGADYTHDVSVIRQLPQFVSVNSAVQVDLAGQVNAEVVGGRQISGTGGSVDFMRAAKLSPGGRSIVALGATARGGSVSRIVERVEHVTALRTDVDIVVTEYGAAELRDLSLAARREALAAIAAPEFREALTG